MTAAIHVEDLVKEFGSTRAVDGVTMQVPAGSVLGLLGPNGAGKTTIVRMLATLARPDGGRARVAGFDIVTEAHQVRGRIGLTGQYASVDETIPGWDNLYLIGRLYRLPPRRAKALADELLERFRLSKAAKKLPRDYSGGMRRRLDLAASLVGDPEVLYLDEPTTGLDPRSRLELWDMVRSLVARGTTVLLTTQYMEEAEALAENIVVIDHGRVIAEGTPAELRGRTGGQVLRIRPDRGADLAEIARQLSGTGGRSAVTDPDEGLITLPVSGQEELTAALHALTACGVPVDGIDTHTPSLDEVFLSLTSGDPADDTRRTA
ncbi:daunorubicin resistance protein DrrA family ABC transporter ATP-binding protein [Streptomyces natalensis]|uniref:ABC-type xenobiotic transporter n=1 Tax=Streptomyces natalensis ATCC 27448 TaxID=1240678 RepID=A0A0D7CNH7_9ACTN|nr:daunorubicin resistance protein DrrA family ABC transporter ATP-binding protein [Streptomyces natalensis]KIZ17626.1 ABC transporter [Streptomyces natalensis ATCC 27448]